MTERLERIFSLIPACDVFADIGCDHGYISKKVLETGRAKKVYASDISAPSLKKAVGLIGDGYDGRFFTFVSDGFENLPKDIDTALIAGMGGEEIIKILTEAPFLPEKLVLQPMKNVRKVREFAVGIGYAVMIDRVFSEGYMFYDLISLKKGEDTLTEEEKEYGRTNLTEPSVAFKKKIRWEIKNIDERIEQGNLKKNILLAFMKKREELKKYV